MGNHSGGRLGGDANVKPSGERDPAAQLGSWDLPRIEIRLRRQLFPQSRRRLIGVLREGDGHFHVQVSSFARPVRQPLPAHAQLMALLSAGSDLDQHRSLQGAHRHRRSQDRFPRCQGQLAHEIRAPRAPIRVLRELGAWPITRVGELTPTA